MFWWLSFLRPPPVTALAAGQVDFIVQITNDLRTELYPDPIDIYFTWASDGFRQLTDPTKLTSWRLENAHKLMTASGPPQAPTLDPAGTGTWSLGLFTCPIGMKPDSSAMLINIADPHSLGGILPVFSAPISFSPSNAAQTRRKVSKSNTKKQDEIQRIYIVPGHNYNSHVQVTEPISKLILSPDERTYRSVVITEKTSPDLDKKVWDSGLSCSSWLARHAKTYFRHPPIPRVNAQTDTDEVAATLDILFTPGCTVLELGTGSGVVSVILATLLNEFHSVQSGLTGHASLKNTRIHSTDLPSAIPLINRNILSNQLSFGTQNEQTSENSHASSLFITAGVLDWEHDQFPEEVIGYPFDVIVMSDVTYNTASFPALLKTLKGLLTLSPHARVILAYKERHSAERDAWPLFEREAHLSFVKVDELAAAGGPPTEIWLGKMIPP